MLRASCLLLIAAHAATLVGHNVAHQGLGVGLVTWQQLYVYSLIVAGPLLAGGLLVSARLRAGYLVLAVCMSAALLFGVYHHYIAISPDHVAHLPVGPHQPLFRSTAALMVVLELGGAGLGAFGYRAIR